MIMDVYVWSYHQYVLYYQAVLETEAKLDLPHAFLFS